MNLSGDDLSCGRCKELLWHSQKVYNENCVYQLKIGTGCIPILLKDSPFNFCPVLQRVCVYTIEEGVDEENDCSDDVIEWMASRDPHRPLFYTELDARKFNALSRRLPRSHPLSIKKRRRAHKKIS